jgi:hypothetical protein
MKKNVVLYGESEVARMKLPAASGAKFHLVLLSKTIKNSTHFLPLHPK